MGQIYSSLLRTDLEVNPHFGYMMILNDQLIFLNCSLFIHTNRIYGPVSISGIKIAYIFENESYHKIASKETEWTSHL